MADWRTREGDTAVIATIDSIPVGAAWYRYWTDDNFILGYIEESMPVVVIAVEKEHRRQGLGKEMLEWLIDAAARQSIQRISLSVSEDN